MTRLTKSLAFLCALLPLAASAAAEGDTAGKPVVQPAAATDEKLFGNPVIAKGTGVSVTREQLDEEILRTKSVLAAQNRTVSPEEEPVLELQLLDKLISQQLVLAKATPGDRAKAKEDFDKTIQMIKTNGRLTEEQYNARLNQQLRLLNQTKEQWEHQNIEQATLPLVLERELNVHSTDQDAQKFYDENPAKFERPETVRAAHILLMTSDPTTHADLPEEKKAEKKKLAEDLLKRAKSGEDFAKLAKEYSEDLSSKENGGEYTFPRGQMVPAFEDAAFSQGTNQISNIVTTQFGYHIIKTYEKFPAKKLTLTDKVPGGETSILEAVKESLTQQLLQQKAPEYISKLRKDAGVEIVDPKYKAAAAAREKMAEGLKDGDVPAARTISPANKPK